MNSCRGGPAAAQQQRIAAAAAEQRRMAAAAAKINFSADLLNFLASILLVH